MLIAIAGNRAVVTSDQPRVRGEHDARTAVGDLLKVRSDQPRVRGEHGARV